ncbi:MAG: glycosyltransferase, partial [Gemmatimonadaceae bacterium]|nr:glycosyltransferase [Gemmatimonadaceae bacterium]
MTVLILNYNGWRDTITCLESVLRLDYPDFRVVVCDNASSDGSVEEIVAWAEGRRPAVVPGPNLPVAIAPVEKPVAWVVLDRAEAEQGNASGVSPALTVIRTGDNRGFAAGNNVGLRHVLAMGTSDHVWLLNNDTVTAPDALRHLVAEAEHDPLTGAVGGTLLELHDPERVQLMAGGTVAFWGSLSSQTGAGTSRNAPRPRPALDFISGGCLLVRTAAVRAAGLLDERFFMYGEDADWSRRIVAAGYRLSYAPAAEVWHKGGGTAGHRSPLHDYHSVRSSLLYVHKHRPRGFRVAAAYCVYRCLLPKIVRGQWARARAVRRAFRDAAASISEAERTAPRNGYLVRNRLWVGYLRVADAALAARATLQKPATPRSGSPRRVLLSVGGHLGDAVIATSAIALVKAAVPGAEIGVLLPSWCRIVLDGHPDVNWLHEVDHWKLNRGPESLPARFLRHRATARRAAVEIRSVGYEAAIDLYPFYPNTGPVLRAAGIPVRAGWSSGGYGPMFTHALGWTTTTEHVTEQHARLLRSALPGIGEHPVPPYALPSPSEPQRARTRELLREHRLAPGGYYLVHPCAGSPNKGWPRERWTELLRALVATGLGVIVTGAGTDQEEFAGTLVREVPGVISLVNRLDWPGVVDVAGEARAVVAVDTAIAHVAAAMGTPVVTLMTGTNDPAHWRPFSPRSGVLTTRRARPDSPHVFG